MKYELLARAIGELDDDLLDEARRPLPGRRPAILPRLAAAAACLALILAAAVLPGSGGSLAVTVNDVALLSGEGAQVPLVAAAQMRQAAGTEIRLSVSAGESTVVTAGSGGVLLSGDGASCSQLTISGDTDICWIVDPTAQDSFDLTLHRDGEAVRITAAINSGQTALIVTADRR